ncbi:MAG: SpoIIE family protein phosphatase [Mariprofundus sp.]|nr:SpoIIE family protein phosphatase [Mariprofundus sp.]
MQTEEFADITCQSQPMLGQAPHCGDGVWSYQHAEGLFGLLCDGSGHGIEAERIQQQALAVTKKLLKTADKVDLIALFVALHAQLRNSRGMVAVAFLLRADGRLDFVHIGDVSLCHFHSNATHQSRFQVARSNEQQGIIGYHMPTPSVQHWQCQPGQWLVAHSDGIRRSTSSDQWRSLLQHGLSTSTIALHTMRQLADGRDDASSIVVHYWGKRPLATWPAGEVTK